MYDETCPYYLFMDQRNHYCLIYGYNVPVVLMSGGQNCRFCDERDKRRKK